MRFKELLSGPFVREHRGNLTFATSANSAFRKMES